MGTVTTGDGVRLAYTDEGDGPVVLLVAGFTAPATSWALQVPALLGAGYRVVALDRRWHGASDRPAHGHRLARHGADVHEVLEALDLRDVVAVGGSMGASSLWARCDLFGTDRLRGVVSVDQTPRMVNEGGWQHGFYGLTPQNSGTFFDGGIPDTGRGIPSDRLMEQLEPLLAVAGPEALPQGMSPETLPLLRDHAVQDWRDVVARLDVPVLMVAARESQYWPWEHATASVEGLPDGRAVVLDDCGHAANLHRPEAFNAALLEFLADL